MATVLALLMSGRASGFTASLLDAAARGAARVEVQRVRVQRHKFGPCTSCFSCIRDEAHACALRDAMGGEGALMSEVRRANGWIIADPVHFWGPSAQCHLFIERCYPFIWSGGLNGMPFASISCASNQGMQRLAREMLCKFAFSLGLRYVGGLAVHTALLEQARGEAEALGQRLGEAALADAQDRRTYPESERWVDYMAAPWSPLEPYIDNLSQGTLTYEGSLLAYALVTFRQPEARALLQAAREPFDQALAEYAAGHRTEACQALMRASALWTHATWKEFLEEDVVGARVPAAYRPIGD
ncbi:MAG: flavodoxin family protein [Anaerolineales bacterium]|nr:flavodoxin family protein [Anaerolineales bacterium]